MIVAGDTAVRPWCTAIVVTYNSGGEIGGLLSSLDNSPTPLRVVVVDNDSSDRTVEEVRRHRDVVLVESGRNAGYAGGINLGRPRAAPGRPILIANPDVRFASGAIEELVRTLGEPRVGIAVPRLIDPHGRLQRSLRREPSILRELGEAAFGDHWAARPGWCAEIVRDDDRYERRGDVDWATGAVFALSAACDEAIGDWDESYFLYSEEVDAAARARDAGFRIRFTPGATAVHVGGASGSSPALVTLMAVNRVRYFERRHGRSAAVVYRIAVIAHELSRGRDPARRTAAGVVADRARWRSLPAATPA